MPYAQAHYPFENKELLDSGNVYPADFIAEGVDQTRGWFFTLHAIATMVFDSVAFKNVISNGLVLDKKGEKMSKHLGNTVNPFEQIEKYGTDPLRWYMMTNSSPWDNLKFDEAGVQDVSRTFFAKLFQTYSFFTMYANVDGFDAETAAIPVKERPEIDRWIISELHTLIMQATADFDDYEPTRAGRRIQNFVIENLSNWYVRLCRKRFWAGEMSHDKLSAYQTLYECLLTVSKLMAPISPFYADRLFTDLMQGRGEESVHLAAYPEANQNLIEKNLEQQMQMAQKITSMVLSLRKKERIIVRQPLQTVAIPVTSPQLKDAIMAVENLILDEVNVKELKFVEDDLLKKSVKCNFRVMGKKFGSLMKAVAAAVGKISPAQIAQLEGQGACTLDIEGGQAVTIERDDVEIISQDMPGWSVVSEGALTVALDINLTPELLCEGLAREIVKRIQTHRKDSGFEITDRIKVTFEPQPQLQEAVAKHGSYISAQVLADEINFGPIGSATEFDFGNFKAQAEILRLEKQ